MKRLPGFAALLLAGTLPLAAQEPIAWQDWSDGVFQRATSERRLVLLDVGAVWCHWCHVMDETTYRDPKVVELVRRHFLAVRVDQDARPDLSNRYEDYGWPATVLLDASGAELVKLSGYIPPPRMAAFLEAVVEDPTPGPSVEPETALSPVEPRLSPELRDELERLLVVRYDEEHGGWGFVKKFLDWDAVEYSLVEAAAGNEDAERRARRALDAQLQLLDPIWGGVYQYSHGGTWDNPHFEKLTQFQAENLRVYALAFGQLHDERYARAGREILRYLRVFLRSPEGAFYVSQDADRVQGEHGAPYFALDDAGRRALGMPRIDRHLYARETAWVASALVAWYEATRDLQALHEAEVAGRFIVARRVRPDGSVLHDEADSTGPYLGDAVASARAFVALHRATGDREWLRHAEDVMGFAARTFRHAGTPGFVTANVAAARPQREENATLARVALALARATGQPAYRAMADDALRFLAIPDVARRFSTASVLLAAPTAQ